MLLHTIHGKLDKEPDFSNKINKLTQFIEKMKYKVIFQIIYFKNEK